MHYRNARALFFVACALLYPLQASAIDSASANYQNTRSSIDSGGRRKTSTNYRADGAAAEISTTSAVSTNYSVRDGLDGIDYYPGRVYGVWGSTGAAPGSVYLQWVAPGNDGYESSTAGSFIVRYSSVAAQSPALSDALFNAAANVPDAPPAPAVAGTTMTMTLTGLAPGVTYYFAVKATERDGLRSVLSAGTTVQSAAVSGCAVTEPVGAGQTYATIQSAVNAIPNPLTGYSCVVIEDGATYDEQVTVRNFTMSASSISIFADPSSGLTPVVDPPAGAAAFVIANASVSVAGIKIIPTHAISYGIDVSSAYVQISSMSIQDSNGRIAAAGVLASSWTTVSASSVTVLAAHGFWLPGSNSTISFSTAVDAGNDGMDGLGKTQVNLQTPSSGGHFALYVTGSSNTFSRGYLANGNSSSVDGPGAFLNIHSSGNTIAFSTVTGNSAFNGAIYNNGGYNLVTSVYAENFNTTAGQTGIYFDTQSYNGVISYSTVPSDSNSVWFEGRNHLLADSFLYGTNPTPIGPPFDEQGLNDVVAFSTITSAGVDNCTTTDGSEDTVQANCAAVDVGHYSGVTFTYGSFSIYNSYLKGEMAGVYVDPPDSGNTMTGFIKISNSVVIASNTAGLFAAGIGYDAGDVAGNAVIISSSVITAYGAAGTAAIAFYHYANPTFPVALDAEQNVLTGAQAGVFSNQTMGTVFLATNTVLMTHSGSRNQYGVYLTGLASGATIQSNAIVYRGPGTDSGSYPLYLGGASINVNHNEIDNPGMITGGSFFGAYFSAATASSFKFNDVNSTGTSLANAYLLDLQASTVTIRDNVFLSSFVVTGSSASLLASANSGFNSDYNDWFSSSTRNTLTWGTKSYAFPWNGSVSEDGDSVSANPLWYSAGAGVEDFHPLSAVGRWNQSLQNMSNVDGVESPTIDAGDPAEGVGLEPSPNGGVANQGSYGLTAQASESQAGYAGCAATRRVGSGQTYATISAALGSLPSSLPAGETCVVIEDGATYAEQVTVQNFTMSASSIAIFAAPGFTPTVNPPAGTAAFVIANASVSVMGLNVVPTHAIAYGIEISSAYVGIISVNVIDPGGRITDAGLALNSNWAAVSESSVTVVAAQGILISGANNSISQSSTTNDVDSDATDQWPLEITGVSAASNTVTGSYIHGVLSDGANFDAGSSYNEISLSTMVTDADVFAAAAMVGGSHNTIAQSYLSAPAGAAVWIQSYFGPTSNNSVTQSTLFSGNYQALYIAGSSSNTLTQDTLVTATGVGAYLDDGAQYNLIDQSTVVAAGGSPAVDIYDSYNTVSRSSITNSDGGVGLDLEGGADGNAISSTTLYSKSADLGGSAPLYVSGSSNAFSGDVAANPQGNGVYLDDGAQYNSISASTVASLSTDGSPAVDVNDSFNSITGSSITDSGDGDGVDLEYADGNSISFSTLSSSGGTALYETYSSSNAASQDYLVSAGYDGAFFYASDYNSIGYSTAVGAPAGFGVFFDYSSYNSITNTSIVDTSDSSLELQEAANGNVISSSTVQGSTYCAYCAGVDINNSSGTVVLGVYSNAVLAASVYGSTNTVIGGGTLVGASIGLYVGGGAENVTLSSSSVSAGAQGSGVYIDTGCYGATILSTNTISGGQYGIYAGTQAAGSQLYVTSNTILAAVTSANNTYGIDLDGLTTGATIENNAVVWRTAGSMVTKTSFGLYAQSSSGLLIDHDRIDDPGMVTGGSFVAADFFGTKNTEFKFNDVNSTGPALSGAYLLEATNSSTHLIVRDNVFLSSFTAPGVGHSSATLVVDATSDGTFAADYNDYFSSNAALAFLWGAGAGSGVQGLANWRTKSGGDADSLTANPLWFNAGAGVEDFHPMSLIGRFLPGGGGPVTDGAQSPTIDAGDPAEGVGLEPSPNGGTANQGSYGLTAQASESLAAYPGCAVTERVGAGQPYATISAAVGALPSSLPAGEACVVIDDNGTYGEQVTVQNFTMTASSIAIFAAPGFTPTVNPPAGTAAFVIANASVSVAGINIAPTHAIAYGIEVSSGYVSISSVNVIDPGGSIGAAGIALSSWTTVSNSSVTVETAHGLWITGSSDTVTMSSMSANGGDSGSPHFWFSLYVNGGSYNAISGSFITNPSGKAMGIDGGGGFNSISLSTVTPSPTTAWTSTVPRRAIR